MAGTSIQARQAIADASVKRASVKHDSVKRVSVKGASKPISIESAVNEFLNRPDSKLKAGLRQDNEFAMLALREYVDTFAMVLVQAQFEPTTNATWSNDPKAAWKAYGVASIMPWLRGFRDFFVEYKVNAPSDKKQVWIQVISEFVDWCVENNLLSVEQRVQYQIQDSKSLVLAAMAQKILQNAITYKNNAGGWDDFHDAEPLYMISRVKTGKLWFIYCAESGPGGYKDFGPIAVPKGVTDLIKPGWAIQASFGQRKGAWQMATVGTVLAI